MRIRAIHVIIFWGLLGGLALFSGSIYNWVHFFARRLFEGFSFGKTGLFFLWQFVFFGFLALGKRSGLKVKDYSRAFIILALASFVLSFVGQLYVMNLFDTSELGVLGVMSSEQGLLSWQGTQLKHTHVPKTALALIQDLTNTYVFTVDNGLSLYRILDQGPLLGLLFLLSSLGILGLSLLTGLHHYRKEGVSKRIVLLSFVSFGLMITMLDGGPLTQGAKVSFGLLALFIGSKKFERSKYRDLLLVSVPLGFMLFVESFFLSFFGQLAGTLHFNLEHYTILIASLLFIGFEKLKSKRWVSLIGVLVLIYLFWQPFTGVLDNEVYGSVVFPGDEAHFFVYGLPSEVSDVEVLAVLNKYGTVTKFERGSWTAYFDFTTSDNVSNLTLEDALIEELNTKTYLYVLRLWNEWTVAVINPSDNISLRDFSSAFVEVESFNVDSLGREQLVVKTRTDSTWTNLFFLDYLYSRGEELPVKIFTE